LNKNLVNAQSKLERAEIDMITTLILTAEAKDPYTHGHSNRVAEYSVAIAKAMKLPTEEQKLIKRAAILHDLGKIGIPDEILQKPGPLTGQEWLLMRRHPEIGESIIKPIGSLQQLCDIIRHHHEKLDGSGYPDGLKGDEITPLVRITAIADIYDALTSDRPYRTKLTSQEVYAELRKMKGKIDQDIVEIFIEALQENADQEVS